MKRNVLSIIFLALATILSAQNIRVDSVSMGSGNPSYPYDVFYNLATGDKDTVVNTNWHLAFAMRPALPPANVMRSTTVRINASRNVTLYKSNFTSNQWSSFDTTGFTAWPIMANGDSSWDVAAFNADYNASNPFDYGWGQYNMNSHNVEGTKMFLLAIGSGATKKYKKITIEKLAYDTLWFFTFSNLDGTDSTTQIISKPSYKGKLFAYYNVLTKTLIDREPNRPWDLVFTHYRTNATFPGFPTSAFNFAGVLQAPQLNVARVANFAKPLSDTTNATNYSKRIGTIGWDWKVTPLGPPPSGPWNLTDSLTYFIKRDKDSLTYKLTFDKFSNVPSQIIVFNIKTYLPKMNTGVSNIADLNREVSLFPNPTEQMVNVSIPSLSGKEQVAVSIIDMTGKVVSSTSIIGNNTQIDLSGFNKGLYFIILSIDGVSSTKKLIIE
jgi:hypothetical protein